MPSDKEEKKPLESILSVSEHESQSKLVVILSGEQDEVEASKLISQSIDELSYPEEDLEELLKTSIIDVRSFAPKSYINIGGS